MQFSIPEQRTVKLRNFQNRAEHHGQDWVYAFTAHLKMTAKADALDLLDPALRVMFWDGDAVRSHKLKGPTFDLTGIELVGWELRVDRATAPIIIGGCKVDAFEFQPKDEGIVDLLFKVHGHCDDEATRGVLAGLINHDISIQLIAPQTELPLGEQTPLDALAGATS